MTRLLLRTAGWAAAVLATACTAALKEPPPVAELGAAGGRRPGAPAAEASEWIRRADAELAGAPDAPAVERARQLFLDAAAADPSRVEAFLGAARATSWLIEHGENGRRREELATEGVQIGQLCARHHPGVVECSYRLALAVGQQARERPATATDGLDVMVELLTAVIADAPELDFAGGHRVLALVLLRSPGWPAGPGDPELALVHAEAAVAAFPEHAPNQLVLGEALADNGRVGDAEEALERGRELAAARLDAGDAEAGEWLAAADKALAGLR